ncbi:MAG: acetylglutamate kinase, partial [Nitrospirae bacterium]
IVSLINRHGGSAIGLTGKDGGLIMARKKLLKKKTETGEDILDLGLVGEVTEVNPEVLESLDRSGFIPVVAPVGVSPEGVTLNINADYVASSIASSMKAEKLILLTDVQGVLDKKGQIISTLTVKEAKTLIKKGVIQGGMIPKVETCIEALKAGVKKTHIIDGRLPHCLLLEIFTEKGIGTEIIP